MGRGSKVSAPSSARKRKRDGDSSTHAGNVADKTLDEEDGDDEVDAADIAIERGWKMDDVAEKQDREHAA